MKNLMGAVCLVSFGLGLVGCSAQAPVAEPAAETTYVSPKKDVIQGLEYQGILSVLRDLDNFYGSWSDDDIGKAVDATCDGLAAGENPEHVRSKIADTFGEDSPRKAFEVQQIMSASIGIRCEEFTSQKAEIMGWDVSPK